MKAYFNLLGAGLILCWKSLKYHRWFNGAIDAYAHTFEDEGISHTTRAEELN